MRTIQNQNINGKVFFWIKILRIAYHNLHILSYKINISQHAHIDTVWILARYTANKNKKNYGLILLIDSE